MLRLILTTDSMNLPSLSKKVQSERVEWENLNLKVQVGWSCGVQNNTAGKLLLNCRRVTIFCVASLCFRLIFYASNCERRHPLPLKSQIPNQEYSSILVDKEKDTKYRISSIWLRLEKCLSTAIRNMSLELCETWLIAWKLLITPIKMLANIVHPPCSLS